MNAPLLSPAGLGTEAPLAPIPAKRYFTIGEVSELCRVKPYVLRYWEQEFSQLKPMKRRGNRRYYQHHEVLLIRRIRELLYEQGFTISGARNRLSESHRLAGGSSVEALSTPGPTPSGQELGGAEHDLPLSLVPDALAASLADAQGTALPSWMLEGLKDLQNLLQEG